MHPSGPRSAAARRRRVVVGLASATLLAVLVVAVGAVTSVAVPGWIVAAPGGLLVAYLVLLAVLRPGARVATGHDGVVEVEPLPSIDEDEPFEPTASGDGALVRAGESVLAHRTSDQRMQPAPPASAEQTAETDGASPSVWTPVPLPTPTYVTAPRARRSVRTIDLSNPGSWTASPLSAAVEAEAAPSAGFLRSTPSDTPGSGAAGTGAASSAGFLRSTPSDASPARAAETDTGGDEYLERRRAVGD